jgi:hypothetical protein
MPDTREKGMVVDVREETQSTDRSTVFISYASQDIAVADAIVAALERAGVACWIAPRDVVPGTLYADETEAGAADPRCRGNR